LGYCIASSLGKTFYLEICVALSKDFKNWSRFYRFIGAGKLCFGFFYHFIGAGEKFFGFFYRVIAGKNILSRNLCRFIKGIQKLELIL
jgi:hypothetical protein